MRVKVIKQFKDKHTKVLHKKDTILEIGKGRFEEINSTPFGVLVEEIKEDGEIDYIAFEKMNKDSIVKYAKEVMDIDLDMKMTKKEMIKELI